MRDKRQEDKLELIYNCCAGHFPRGGGGYSDTQYGKPYYPQGWDSLHYEEKTWLLNVSDMWKAVLRIRSFLAAPDPTGTSVPVLIISDSTVLLPTALSDFKFHYLFKNSRKIKMTNQGETYLIFALILVSR